MSATVMTSREQRLQLKRERVRQERTVKRNFEDAFMGLDLWVNIDSFLLVAYGNVAELLAIDPELNLKTSRDKLTKFGKWLNLLASIRQARCLNGDCNHGENCGWRDVEIDPSHQVPPLFKPGTNNVPIVKSQPAKLETGILTAA